MSGTAMGSLPTPPLIPYDFANDTATISDEKTLVCTDAKTVMAEQIGHNVVNQTQSTSGSPLVDVASKTTTAHSAANGTQSLSSNDESTSTLADLSKSTNESAISANASTSNGQTGLDPAASVVEPSAGDIALKAGSGSGPDVVAGAGEKQSDTLGDLPNGHRDDASQGDGMADDRSTADMSIDVSINSDTDNSRADAAEKKDGNHHMRTNSVKKPAAFSKVTATKNFMNKIAPSAPATPKLGEKPASPATASTAALSSKPRLVAKTGASLANLQKSRTGAEGSGGPDASKVWNKNRPVAPPPPRQFTDEELKQQYGIHLATRLQTDESGKDSKWADIDDDEDDWAPEAVVWIDGTKSTLTPQDAVPPAQEEAKEKELPGQKPAPALIKPADGVRPVLALKQRTDMKILKPGAAGVPTKLDGISAPSPGPEKQSLKAKTAPQAPAPAPAKSPWAPVPKVESVSPVNPPMQPPPPPRAAMPSQDARSYEPAPAPPAREIAADTFDRSWREGEGGARELFNSTNGRYEPAPEGRRTSVKPDSAFRKPALLQRSNQGGVGPAEPSSAFQSRTSAQMDGSWGRRRGSSASQGSLPLGRRMSVNQRPELAQTPEIPQEIRSPHSVRAEPAKPSFAQQSAWDQQMPPKPDSEAQPEASAPPAEDPVEVQERVMREKRELAVKRRKEEEVREEVAKQERLKAKLAALSGAGKSKKERDAEAAAAAAVKETPAREKPTEPAQKTTLPEPAKPAQASAASAPALEAQTLPPAPEFKPAPSLDKLPSPLPPKPSAVSDRSASNEQTRQTPRAHLSPRASARVPSYQQQSASYKTPASSYSSPGDRKLQPAFGRSPNLAGNHDAFSPWPTTAPNSNVWGSSGIGNGTFESASSFAPIQSSSLPPPPGMARTGTASSRISPQSFNQQDSRSPSMQQQQVTEQQRAFPPPGMDSRPEPFPSQSRLNGVSAAPGAGRPVHTPGPIGPPSRTQQQPQRSDPISAWNNATTALPGQYAHDIAAAEERRRQEMSMPAKPPVENRYKETFKKTSADQGKLGAPRKYDSTEYTIHDGQGSRSVSSLSPAPPSTQTQPSAPFSTASPVQQGNWKQPVESAVRIPDPSRNPAHGGAQMQQPPVAPPTIPHHSVTAYQGNTRFPTAPIAPIVETGDQSPPPPDTENHPVNEGDASHPHVKLPPPQAKVKLPPTSPSGVAHVPVQQNNGSVLMPQRPFAAPWGPPGVNRPIVQQQAWQARFNGLLGRAQVSTETPPSPPKTPPKMQGPSPAVASSSRTAMDVQTTGATVSLPQSRKRISPEGFVIDDSSERSSKPTIDGIFEEERSFGSMPTIRVPRSTSYNKTPYPANAKNMLDFPNTNSRLHKHVEAETRQNPFFWQHPDGIFVTIPRTRFHNKLVRRPGAPERPPRNGDRKVSSAQTQEREDRRPSGRFNKSKNQDAAPESSEKTTPAADGQKKSGHPKLPRQPSNSSAAPAGDEAVKAEGSTEKRKSGWGSRGGRGKGHAAAPPAATSAPAVKSN